METSENGDKKGKCGFFSRFSRPSAPRRNLIWAQLGLLALFLVGGGFYAWFAMGRAAHKLAGGEKYKQLTSESLGRGGEANMPGRGEDFFGSDETLTAESKAILKAEEEKRLLEEEAELAAAAGLDPEPQGQAAPSSPASFAASVSAPGRSSMAEGLGKLQTRAALLGGAGVSAGGAKTASITPIQGAGDGQRPAVGRISEGSGGPARGGNLGSKKTSVLESLRAAFKGSVHGARLASADAAKNWTAQSFDNTYETNLAVQYDEKMKAKLDRINPNSIPRFLRDQNLDAGSARSLGISEAVERSYDAESTREAWKGDEEYQRNKAAKNLASGMMNPMFGGVASSMGGVVNDESADKNTERDGRMADPVAEPDPEMLFLEYLDMYGCGEECGCSCNAPCCCLPPSGAGGYCSPMGPYMDGDPCGAGMDGGLYDGGGLGCTIQFGVETCWA